MKNNKGYMLVEIILASVIAFGIAYFILDMTIKLKNKNDDLLVETQVMTDKTIITNKFMKYAISENKSFDCKKIHIEGNTIYYDSEIIDVLNNYASFNGELFCYVDLNKSVINISIPLGVKQMTDKDFDIDINYKYIPDPVYNVTYDWNYNIFTCDTVTINGLTATCDNSTGILTLNGTYAAQSFRPLSDVVNRTFSVGDTYYSNLTYVSGSYVNSGGGDIIFLTEAVNNDNLLTNRIDGVHYIASSFPTSSDNSKTWTVNSTLSSTEANGLQFWIWQDAANSVSFDNYKVKITFERKDKISNSVGDNYVIPDENPVRDGYVFKGWYTESTGGNLVTINDVMTRNEEHTLYAHYDLETAPDTVAPTCSLKASSSTISFKTKSDNVAVDSFGLIKSATPTYNNTSSLSIDTGTYYGYVKDAAGNTGSCKIIIKATNKTTTYTCKHNYDACSSGTKYNGGCWTRIRSRAIGPCCAADGCYAPCSECVNYAGNCVTCDSGYSLYGSAYCQKYAHAYDACSSGTKSGGACYKYNQTSCASGWTKAATNNSYSCDTGYTKINNNYCYK